MTDYERWKVEVVKPIYEELLSADDAGWEYPYDLRDLLIEDYIGKLDTFLPTIRILMTEEPPRVYDTTGAPCTIDTIHGDMIEEAIITALYQYGFGDLV